MITAVVAAFGCAVALGADFPCSIEQVRSTVGGAAIRFSEKMFWYYEDSLGNYGIIGVGGVKQFVELPNGREDVLPSQAELQLKWGASLKLREHHAGCLIEFESGGKRALRITRSFSFNGKSSTEIHVVPYE